MSNHETSGLTVCAATLPAIREAYRQSLDVLSEQGFCVYGQYPWDDWQRMALARGVPEALATLGRAVMREAHQHAWCDRFRSLCGWNDEGRRMIALALRSPEIARRRWEWLLESDGRRVDPATHEWIGEESGEWPRLRRRWIRERRA